MQRNRRSSSPDADLKVLPISSIQTLFIDFVSPAACNPNVFAEKLWEKVTGRQYYERRCTTIDMRRGWNNPLEQMADRGYSQLQRPTCSQRTRAQLDIRKFVLFAWSQIQRASQALEPAKGATFNCSGSDDRGYDSACTSGCTRVAIFSEKLLEVKRRFQKMVKAMERPGFWHGGRLSRYNYANGH